MKFDSWASFLARTFASPCLGHEPKVGCHSQIVEKRESDMEKCNLFPKDYNEYNAPKRLI
jgi:hypothetical protein